MSVARKYMEIELDELRIQEVPYYDAQCSAVFKGTYFHEDVVIKSLGSGLTSHTSASMFSDDPPRPDLLLDLRHEVSVMRRLSHSNIVRFKGIVIDPPSIVLEYCEKGSLWNLIPESYSALKAKWEINSEDAWIWRLNIAVQIARGMHYLHKQSPAAILHNDLKSPNIFIDGNWCVKIGDFGSASMGEEKPSKLPDNNTWKCPEVMKGEQPTVKSDVFSFAVILWELYSFERPWDNLCDSWDLSGKLAKFAKNRRIEEKVLNGERLRFPDQVIGGKCNGIQKEFRQLIEKCWKQRPKDRPDFAEIIKILTTLLEKLTKPKDSGMKTRLVSLKELKEARTSRNSFSFGKLNSIPQDPSWPPVAMKPTKKSTVKQSNRSHGKWMLFNLSKKLMRGVRPLMRRSHYKSNAEFVPAMDEKPYIRSHVVNSFSTSSDSLPDDLYRAGGLSDGSIRSPFETGPSFLKDADKGVDWSCFCKGDSSIGTSRSIDSSRVASMEVQQKKTKSRTDSLAATEKALHEWFATDSSSFDGLDAYTARAREFHDQENRHHHPKNTRSIASPGSSHSDCKSVVSGAQMMELCSGHEPRKQPRNSFPFGPSNNNPLTTALSLLQTTVNSMF